MSAALTGRRRSRAGRLRLSSALGFYAIRFRRRWVQELLAILGIAVGVALLYASQVASTSMSGPVRALNSGIVGHSQLQLIGRGGTAFTEQTYDEVMAIAGVARAAPILQVPGNAAGPKGEQDITLYGADPRIVRLRGDLLRGFGAADAANQEAVALTAPVARAIGINTGDDARLDLAGRSVTVPVVVAGREQVGGLVNTSIALAPLAYLQRLSRQPGVVSRVLVEAKPGAVESVRHDLGELAKGSTYDVRPSMWDADLFDSATAPWKESSATFGALSALVGWLFAVCALLVTAADRRAVADEQYDNGFPPSATLKTLLVDAGVIGVVGAGVGLLLGEILSRRGFSNDLSFLSGAFPIGDERVVTWQSVAIAGLGGILAAVVGVLAPVGQVVRRALPGGFAADVRGANARPATSRWPRAYTALGAGALMGAVAITVAAPGLVVIGLVLLGLAVVLLLPPILAASIAGLDALNERTRCWIPCVLAIQQLKSAQWRTRAIAIAAIGAVAVFGATSLQGARANLQAGLDHVSYGLDDVADVWVSPTGAGHVFGTTSFDPGARPSPAGSPAVAGVASYRAGLLDIAGTRAWVIGPPRTVAQPVPPGNVREGDLRSAGERIRSGGWATLSTNVADRLRLGLGDAFVLPSPRPLRVRLAAITNNFGWPGGSIILNADDFATAWGSRAVAADLVHLAPGVSPRAGVVAVARSLRSPGLHAETAQQRVDKQSAASRGGLSRLRQIAQLTLLAAVLAMVAAMTGLLWQHRPVVTELKLNGLGTRVIWSALVIEAAVLFCVGALAGVAFSLIGQLLGTRGVQVVTGFPVVDGLRWDVILTTTGLVIASSLVAVACSGYLVARVRPDWSE